VKKKTCKMDGSTRSTSLGGPLVDPSTPSLRPRSDHKIPANQLKPTPGLEPGTPSLRVKRVYLADFAICLQMPESRQTTKSVEVRRSPQRSSDVFQRCSNRSASRSAIGSPSRSAAGAGFCPYTPSGVVYPERALRHSATDCVVPLSPSWQDPGRPSKRASRPTVRRTVKRATEGRSSLGTSALIAVRVKCDTGGGRDESR
jgi:hypothetical protein